MWQFLEDTLAKIGDFVSNITTSIIKWASTQGLKISPIGAKIISIIILLILSWLVIKLLQNLKPLIKWAIFILLIILAFSVGVSFFI